MKNYNIKSNMIFIYGFFLLLFFFVNIFTGRTGDKGPQDCQPYLENTNVALRHVKVMSNTIVPPYERCVNQLERPGASRRWMVSSYINLMKYYENIPGSQWEKYQAKLNKEK